MVHFQIALIQPDRVISAYMKSLTIVLAIVAIFNLSACCTGIVERRVPAKSCPDGKCMVKAKHHKH